MKHIAGYTICYAIMAAIGYIWVAVLGSVIYLPGDWSYFMMGDWTSDSRSRLFFTTMVTGFALYGYFICNGWK